MKSSGREELYDVYDEAGRRLGRAPRAEVHRNPGLIHRAVHVLVFNRRGELLLQKRAATKDIEPGRWDTSVGGHLDAGEEWLAAAGREMQEELGVAPGELVHLYDFRYRSELETEDIRTYRTEHEGPFHPNPEEVEALRFFSLDEIRRRLGTGFFSRNFEEEFRHVFRTLQRER
jgi:isopentenyldiphosphate isomerase